MVRFGGMILGLAHRARRRVHRCRGLRSAWLLLACGVLGCHAEVQSSLHHDVVVYQAPPPRPESIPRPPKPHPTAIWASGHWDWNAGRWVWERGRWMGGRRGYRYVHARWVRRGKGWVFRAGGWQRQRTLPDAAASALVMPALRSDAGMSQ